MKEETITKILEEIRKLELARKKINHMTFTDFDAGMLKAYNLILKWEKQ